MDRDRFIRNDPSDGGLPECSWLAADHQFQSAVRSRSAAWSVRSCRSRGWCRASSSRRKTWCGWRRWRSNAFSPVLPDLSLPSSLNAPCPGLALLVDVHRIPGELERRCDVRGQHRDLREPAVRDRGRDEPAERPCAAAGGNVQVAGETVVEAIWGHSAQRAGRIWRGCGPDGALAVVFESEPDPVVRPGDWIADVTYERNALTVYNPSTQSRAILERQPAARGSESVQQRRVGQPAGAAVFLVPGAEGDSGDRRSVYGSQNCSAAAVDGGVCRSIASGRTILSGPGTPAGLATRP